jgi:23S rRNA (adenine2503-C2)-methyltransferase
MTIQLKPKNLLGLTLNELASLAAEMGQPSYRGRQLYDAIYRQRVESIQQISTLPIDFRAALDKAPIQPGLPAIQQRFLSTDGTVRYLLAFGDGESVETVYMPVGDGSEVGGENDASGNGGDGELQRDWARTTICVSSQVGCAVDCQFCLTALLGMKRNLTAGEIVAQVCTVLNDQKILLVKERVNLVFMGMGEPFLNFDNLMKAVRLLVEGVGIPVSHMTVSTAGIVPRIYDFGAETVRPKLAISLNAPNDELRTEIMPINRKWNLGKLMLAARDFPLRSRERITFEYVLLHGVNDSERHAQDLAELVRGLHAKVNLIAFNPGPEIAFRTPEENQVLRFQNTLVRAHIPAFLRRPRGRDIYAACGQLKCTTRVDGAESMPMP